MTDRDESADDGAPDEDDAGGGNDGGDFDERPFAAAEPSHTVRPPARRSGTLSRIVIAALAVTALYGVLLALLTGDERGGLVRLIGQAPGNAGPWLLGGTVVALALTVLLGLWALTRNRPPVLSLLPAIALLGAGGVLSGLAAQAGAAKVLAATEESRRLVLRAALSHAAFPRVLALTGASMLVGLVALVGLVRLHQSELPSRHRWGPFAALGMTLLLGASLPLTWSSMSLAASPLSLVPLAATHYFSLAVLAFAFPRALRLRTADDDALSAQRALVLVCGCGPLATLLSWQASVAAARSAPMPSAGRSLADALTLLGPQAVGVTVAAAALVILAAGNGIRRALSPRPASVAALVLLAAAAATYVWAAIAEAGIRPPSP